MSKPLKIRVKFMTVKRSKKNNRLKDFFTSKKNIPMFFVIAFLVGVFVFSGVSVVNQKSDISLLERQRDEIAVKYEEQVEENEKLQAVLDNENKDDYIEQKAREKGYVKSDEVVFYDISAGE